MNALLTLFQILCAIAIFFLVFPFFTVLLSLFRRKEKIPANATKTLDYGCIITAYKNAEIAKPLVQSLLRQNYDNNKFHIYLLADAADISKFDIKDERFSLFRPEEPLNLKAKSIIYCVERFVRKHDYTVVFDADNLAHPDFLATINRYASAGHLCIQGQRTAKNLDTVYACADAIGEFYKNYVERYVPYLLGSSSVISGSGMATETELYKSYLYGPEITKGKELWKKMLQEDKILQNHLLDENVKISYAKDAIVYDEKVSSGDAVTTQRSRWLFSYFQNFPNSSRILAKGLFGLRWNQFVFGLITIAPPLFILLFSSWFLGFLGLFIQAKWTVYLILANVIFVLNIFFSLYLSNVPSQVWKGLSAIPGFVLRQVSALAKMRNPNKNFKHSEHNVSVSIDEILKSQQK